MKNLFTNKTNTVIQSLHYWSDKAPNKIAFSFINNKGERSTDISYQELRYYSEFFAETILADIKIEDRVALIFPTGPEFIIAFFGCLIAHAIPVPLSQPTRQHGTENIRHILKNAEPALCLTNQLLLSSLSAELNQESDFKKSLPIRSFVFSDFISETKDALELKPQLTDVKKINSDSPPEDKIAFLQYTSGSTSAPKGVMVSHKNIFSNHQMIRDVFGHNEETRQLNWMPLYHDMGLIGHVLHPVCNGHTSFLMDPFSFVQRPRIWLESISRFRITSTGGPNFCYQHCVKRIKPQSIQSLDLSCLCIAYNGAEPINPDIIERFTRLCEPVGFNKNSFLPCFGLAEATLLVSGIKHNEPLKYFTAGKQSVESGFVKTATNMSYHNQKQPPESIIFPSLGKPAAGIDIKIINPKTETKCNSQEIGEVCLQGENITQGYWNNDKETADTFLEYNDKNYLRTGDLGFLDQNGELFITGRLKDLIIIDGKNHYPQDIEFTTQAVDDLLKENSCAVFTIEATNDIKNIHRLIVIQELDRRYKNKADTNKLLEIKENIRQSISQHHALAVNDVVLIDCNTMPKTTSGKIKRHHAKYLYVNHLLKEVREN